MYTCVTGFAPNTPQSAPGNLCNSKTWMDVLPQLQDEQQAGKYLRDTSVYRNGFDCYEYNSSNCRGGEFLQERDTSSATWLQPINYEQAKRETKQSGVSAGLGDNPPTGCPRAGLNAPTVRMHARVTPGNQVLVDVGLLLNSSNSVVFVILDFFFQCSQMYEPVKGAM